MLCHPKLTAVAVEPGSQDQNGHRAPTNKVWPQLLEIDDEIDSKMAKSWATVKQIRMTALET
jgi:hypothetical protein